MVVSIIKSLIVERHIIKYVNKLRKDRENRKERGKRFTQIDKNYRE